MTETTMIQSDLDRLTERVEKAAQLIQRLREEHQQISRERDEMSVRLREMEGKIQGQDIPALMGEISALKREQRDWQGERREVASRIETLVKKLERLEA